MRTIFELLRTFENVHAHDHNLTPILLSFEGASGDAVRVNKDER